MDTINLPLYGRKSDDNQNSKQTINVILYTIMTIDLNIFYLDNELKYTY